MLEKGYESVPFKEVNITLKRLPKAFWNYKIAHISDLHLTPSTPLHALENLVHSLNALPLDLIAITGDLYDARAYHIRSHLAILKKLKAPVYFVSGNHELYYLRHRIQRDSKRLGFHCLDNTCFDLEKEGDVLQLIGLSDAYSAFFGMKRPLKTLAKRINPDVCSILLAHQPKDITFALQNTIDLQLSGHTHAGQIYPFGYLVRLFQPYLYGLHRKNNTHIYVTSGYGCWGINWRFHAPSEVALITLKGEQSEAH